MIFLASSPRQPSTGNEHHAGYTVKPITVYIPNIIFKVPQAAWSTVNESKREYNMWSGHVMETCDHSSGHVIDKTYLKVTTNSLFSTMINVIYQENHKTWHKCCSNSFRFLLNDFKIFECWFLIGP